MLPHREKYLNLGLEFVEGLIGLYEELVEKVGTGLRRVLTQAMWC
jgi:hypothetical protein